MSLAPLDIQGVVHEMYASGLSARTAQYAHAVLHAALEQAVSWRLIQRNPARGVALPKATQREMRVLNPDDARRFLEHALDTRYGILFALALTTGLRPSEYLGAALVGHRLGKENRHGRASPGEGKWLELLSNQAAVQSPPGKT